MHKRSLIIAVLIFFAECAAFASPVRTSLSQKIVGSQESFTIDYSTSENLSQQPDFSPLQTDFEILSNSQGYRTSIVNGKVDHENRWTLTLMAKREGKLVIPAIQFGPEQSLPETIEVIKSAASDQGELLFLEAGLQSRENIYEQTQLIYTIRLYRSVNLGQATLSEVKVNDPDAIIERLGQDVEYEHFHTNGKRYLVLERKYAIFPQKSGELVISPTVFEGQVLQGSRSFFDLQGQYKRAKSEEIKVQVLPIPAPFKKGDWFSANNVTLMGEWSKDPTQVPLGEPVTWTLTLIAEGNLGGNIPDVPFQVPSHLKHYCDKPQITNEARSDGFAGTKQLKVVIMATQAGEYPIPEISMNWWNLKTNQICQTKLPETMLRIADGAVALAENPVAAIDEGAELRETSRDSQPLPIWVYGLVGLNGALIAAVAIYFTQKALRTSFKPSRLKQIKLHLQKACLDGDARAAEAALLDWARLHYPQEKTWNLASIKLLVPEQLQTAIHDLYQALYGGKRGWKGESLWQAFSAFEPHRKTGKKSMEGKLLRSLYPDEETAKSPL